LASAKPETVPGKERKSRWERGRKKIRASVGVARGKKRRRPGVEGWGSRRYVDRSRGPPQREKERPANAGYVRSYNRGIGIQPHPEGKTRDAMAKGAQTTSNRARLQELDCTPRRGRKTALLSGLTQVKGRGKRRTSAGDNVPIGQNVERLPKKKKNTEHP